MTFIEIALPWFLSFTSTILAWKLGDRSKGIFLWLFVNQLVWFAWIVLSGNWGLMPMTLVFAGVYLRNHLLWVKGND